MGRLYRKSMSDDISVWRSSVVIHINTRRQYFSSHEFKFTILNVIHSRAVSPYLFFYIVENNLKYTKNKLIKYNVSEQIVAGNNVVILKVSLRCCYVLKFRFIVIYILFLLPTFSETVFSQLRCINYSSMSVLCISVYQ